MTLRELVTTFLLGAKGEALTAFDATTWLYERASEIGFGGFIVEIGTWCGWTAAAMALGGPTVLCVDTFIMSGLHVRDQAGQLQTLSPGEPRPGTLDIFAKRVAGAGLGERVVAVQAKSLEAAVAMPHGVADLVFIDGDHELEAVRADVRAWAPVVKPGGLLCLDNWELVKEAVLPAWTEYCVGWSALTEGCHQIWWTRKP